jgi:hypothetical protein
MSTFSDSLNTALEPTAFRRWLSFDALGDSERVRKITPVQILILVLILLSGAQLGFGAEPSPFQIRAISDVATATTSEYPPPKAEVPSKSVFVESTVLLDHTAIERVSLEEGSAGFVHFDFTFNEAGKKRIDKIMRQYIGKRPSERGTPLGFDSLAFGRASGSLVRRGDRAKHLFGLSRAGGSRYCSDRHLLSSSRDQTPGNGPEALCSKREGLSIQSEDGCLDPVSDHSPRLQFLADVPLGRMLWSISSHTEDGAKRLRPVAPNQKPRIPAVPNSDLDGLGGQGE